jgi:hypothetical protein
MPLKRATPSFTVEYRQAKRPNASAKLGWARAQPAPEVAEKASRVAISAFKTEAALGSGQADAKRVQSRSHGSAARAGHVTQVTRDRTAARQLGEHTYSAEDREPLVALGATTPRSECPTPSDPRATKARTPRSEKRIRRPSEKRAKFDRPSRVRTHKVVGMRIEL